MKPLYWMRSPRVGFETEQKIGVGINPPSSHYLEAMDLRII